MGNYDFATSFMKGEKNLATLLKQIQPKLNKGEYVFVTLKNPSHIGREETQGC